MARPIKSGLDYFPIWKPTIATNAKFGSSDVKVRYKYLRNSSSSFIKKENVRNLILKKCNDKCVKCNSNISLQVDHIVSVYQVANGNYPISKLNIYDNLQILCAKCNQSKNP
jgi:5-methylcytosine-specific restriction endonuclease McrA